VFLIKGPYISSISVGTIRRILFLSSMLLCRQLYRTMLMK
jgi:hypothetical protein